MKKNIILLIILLLFTFSCSNNNEYEVTIEMYHQNSEYFNQSIILKVIKVKDNSIINDEIIDGIYNETLIPALGMTILKRIDSSSLDRKLYIDKSFNTLYNEIKINKAQTYYLKCNSFSMSSTGNLDKDAFTISYKDGFITIYKYNFYHIYQGDIIKSEELKEFIYNYYKELSYFINQDIDYSKIDELEYSFSNIIFDEKLENEQIFTFNLIDNTYNDNVLKTLYIDK